MSADSSISLETGMSDAQIIVNSSDLINKAEEVENAISIFTKCFEEITQTIDGSKGLWIGPEGDTQRKYYDDEKENIENILKRFKDHPRNLMVIAGNYEQTENKIQSENAALSNDII